MAVIGPYSSGCAKVEIPTLNRAPGGPLALVSPSNSHPHLTKQGFAPDAPEIFYPTGERNYARLSPSDDLEGAALAMLATQLGLKSVYLIDDGVLWDTPLTDSVPRTAERVGLTIAGAKAFDPGAKSFEALANEVARSDAQGVMLDAFLDDGGGDRVLRALRARLGPRVPIMATSGLSPDPRRARESRPRRPRPVRDDAGSAGRRAWAHTCRQAHRGRPRLGCR